MSKWRPIIETETENRNTIVFMEVCNAIAFLYKETLSCKSNLESDAVIGVE